jgi:phospholipase C
VVFVVGVAFAQAAPPTSTTPIHHLVVIFQENNSFAIISAPIRWRSTRRASLLFTLRRQQIPPSSVALIGRQGDQANHQYDLNAFWAALNAGNLPAVSFLKAPANKTGHPQTSGALLEQTFLVDTINTLQRSGYWPDMAIIITYDDSDGWYDHVMSPIVNQSSDAVEDSICGTVPLATGAFNDRCGYGERLPLL